MPIKETLALLVASFDWHHAMPFLAMQTERRGTRLDINDVIKTLIMAVVSMGFTMYVAQQVMANELAHIAESSTRNSRLIEKLEIKLDKHIDWEMQQRLIKP